MCVCVSAGWNLWFAVGSCTSVAVLSRGDAGTPSPEGGAVGHFVSWPMEGQSSTSRSGWGHHRGPVSTGGGGFSSGGEN